MDTSDLLSKIRELQWVVREPWSVKLHGSGSTTVHMRTGDGFNEYGAGMLYASILLYNQGAYSDGATDDGVQQERHAAAALIVLLVNHLNEIEKALEEKST